MEENGGWGTILTSHFADVWFMWNFFSFSQKSGASKENFLGLPLVGCIIFEETTIQSISWKGQIQNIIVPHSHSLPIWTDNIISFYSSSWYGRFMDRCFISWLSGISFLPIQYRFQYRHLNLIVSHRNHEPTTLEERRERAYIPEPQHSTGFGILRT